MFISAVPAVADVVIEDVGALDVIIIGVIVAANFVFQASSGSVVVFIVVVIFTLNYVYY